MLSLVQTGILLLAAVLALTALARRLLIPYPILLVLGGLALAMVPGLPPVRLDPDLVFLIFLPPILWAAAYFTSLRDFRQNLRPISLLAVGLVLATTAAVAAVARLIVPGLGWPAAFALGAIVSPPDAVAATAVARRLAIPRRVITVLEGESLVNDAAALVLYRSAVAAMIGGSFGVWEGLGAVRAERGGRRRDRARRGRRHPPRRSGSPTRASPPSRSPCWPPTWPGSSPSGSTPRRSSPAWPAASTSASTSARSSRP